MAKTMSKNINHKYIEKIVCPYCGYTHIDSWQFPSDYETLLCSKCGKKFSYTRHIDVQYSTKKIK
jgi:transcription elongation factor Elf1